MKSHGEYCGTFSNYTIQIFYRITNYIIRKLRQQLLFKRIKRLHENNSKISSTSACIDIFQSDYKLPVLVIQRVSEDYIEPFAHL